MSPYEDGILRSLRRISRALDLYSRRLATRVGLTGPQLVCLRYIQQIGPVSPSRIAREIHLSQATVTGIVDRLATAGWVVRKRGVTDRRVVTVEITETGASVLASAPSPLHDRLLERLGELPEEEQAEILRSLERVVAMMDAEQLPVEPLPETGALQTPELVLEAGSAASDDESELTR
jgi:DNA-binding MarR family transcriptional regulator